MTVCQDDDFDKSQYFASESTIPLMNGPFKPKQKLNSPNSINSNLSFTELSTLNQNETKFGTSISKLSYYDK